MATGREVAAITIIATIKPPDEITGDTDENGLAARDDRRHFSAHECLFRRGPDACSLIPYHGSGRLVLTYVGAAALHSEASLLAGSRDQSRSRMPKLGGSITPSFEYRNHPIHRSQPLASPRRPHSSKYWRSERAQGHRSQLRRLHVVCPCQDRNDAAAVRATISATDIEAAFSRASSTDAGSSARHEGRYRAPDNASGASVTGGGRVRPEGLDRRRLFAEEPDLRRSFAVASRNSQA